MSELNYWAILLAALGTFFLGGPWYSQVMFGKLWNREAQSAKPPGSGHPAKVFGLSFLFSLIAATGFAYLLGPSPKLTAALETAFIVGGCFVASSYGINYQFANRSTLMWLIDAGYHMAQFVVFALILALWH